MHQKPRGPGFCGGRTMARCVAGVQRAGWLAGCRTCTHPALQWVKFPKMCVAGGRSLREEISCSHCRSKARTSLGRHIIKALHRDPRDRRLRDLRFKGLSHVQQTPSPEVGLFPVFRTVQVPPIPLGSLGLALPGQPSLLPPSSTSRCILSWSTKEQHSPDR